MYQITLVFSAFLAFTTLSYAQSRQTADRSFETREDMPRRGSATLSDASSAAKPPVPVYISLIPDLNQYYLYADGGWDGHWYVGYNSCWIVKLPPIPPGDYSKAFIGAKIGRAKTTAVAGKPWERTPCPGKIYMGLSQSPSFSSKQTYFLIEGSDIPLEPVPNDNIKGVGSSQWFWAEVPLRHVSADEPNFLAIWSSSEYFVSSSSSPILAGAENRRRGNVWLNRSIRGVPPRNASEALETPVQYLQPAMVMKLIPVNEYKVFIKGFIARIDSGSIVLSFSVIGQDVRAGWIELSHDRFYWQRVSRIVTRPPYSFTLKKGELPDDVYYFRAAAVDTLENSGHSKTITIPMSGNR